MEVEIEPPYTVIIPGVSEEEFYARCDEDSPWELIEGEMVMHSPASNRHEELVQFFIAVLSGFVGERHLGEVRGSRYPVHAGPSSLPEPDVLFVSSDGRARMTERCLEGPADFIIEIASESSRRHDLQTKRRLYLEAGVREYWVVDPKRRVLYRFLHGAASDSEHTGGRLEAAAVPGFWIEVDWLWQEPLPPTFTTAARILGIRLPEA